MNKRQIKLSFVLLLILLISQQLTAQSTTGRRSSNPPAPTTFELSITSNVNGANVDINNGAVTGVTPFKTNMAPGSFIVVVSAPGYQSVRQRINFQSAQTYDFQLQPTTSSLNVTSNVDGTSIQVRGPSNTQGNAPFRADLPRGNYTITATARGYDTQTQTVNLNSNKRVDFQLQPTTARLNVTSNVNGADLRISGPTNTQGNAPFRVDLPLGNYTITASAEGYDTQTNVINLQRHENVHFNLKKSNATVQIIIPSESLNMKDVNARSLIRIFDNGTEIDGANFQIRPGQHTIQIVSGGLMIQTTIIAEAGKTYTIKPQLTLIVE